MWPFKAKTGHEAIVGGRPRSPKWPAFRKAWLAIHPECAACGNRKPKDVQVHHRQPLHHGGDELSEDNLITLCESGPGGTNCHILIGHCGDWKDWNQTVDYDAARMKVMLSGRIEG